MSSTYSTNLAIELIGTGDQAGNWGSTTNTNLGTLIEQAISGYTTYSCTGGTDVLTMTNGASATARNMYLELGGTGGGTLQVPANKKLYFVYNTNAAAVTVKVSGGTGISVPASAKMLLVCNGTDVYNAVTYFASATLASPTLTGTPVAPTASVGTNTTQIATTAFVNSAIVAAYPVGSIYMSTVSTNPNTLFGFGTWVAFGAGRVLIGDGGGYSAGTTGGSADAITVSHTHTFSATTGNNNSSLSHQHDLLGSNDHYVADGGRSQGGTGAYPYSTGGSTNYGTYIASSGALNHTHDLSGTTASTGSSGTGANLQPYIVVYMWNRTA